MIPSEYKSNWSDVQFNEIQDTLETLHHWI